MQKMLQLLGDRRAMLQEEGKSQRGFTLVELLVVVIIIGILAGIAIPVFLNQREAAWRAEVESDLKNLALAIETESVANNGSYSGMLTGTDLAGTAVTARYPGFRPSSATTTYTLAATGSPVGRNFTISADHNDLTVDLTYDSNAGGLQAWPTTP
ncbi:type IV pilin protein [Agrococcus sp. TF02-05]|uniref:type IV pilin protein n=1 Tax=Agrococcus sp. TF02-05 TaxID=2815211 RepID=UPI002442C181|nr:prepilin-type N-terminal cleavage/methylation domain-containing protein [Agrococcus sp. TF02-05]